jgi:hypothetical protein
MMIFCAYSLINQRCSFKSRYTNGKDTGLLLVNHYLCSNKKGYKMRYRCIVLMLSFLIFGACSKEEKGWTKAQVQLKADSILKAEMPKLKQRAKEDLNNRLPIELKPKVDSILKISYTIPSPPKLKGAENDSMGKDSASKKKR